MNGIDLELLRIWHLGILKALGVEPPKVVIAANSSYVNPVTVMREELPVAIVMAESFWCFILEMALGLLTWSVPNPTLEAFGIQMVRTASAEWLRRERPPAMHGKEIADAATLNLEVFRVGSRYFKPDGWRYTPLPR